MYTINVLVGSNPEINFGHGWCTVAPASVSAQHSHPSNVPRHKCRPAITDETGTF